MRSSCVAKSPQAASAAPNRRGAAGAPASSRMLADEYRISSTSVWLAARCTVQRRVPVAVCHPFILYGGLGKPHGTHTHSSTRIRLAACFTSSAGALSNRQESVGALTRNGEREIRRIPEAPAAHENSTGSNSVWLATRHTTSVGSM